MLDSATEIHVCMPTLSIIALLLLRRRKGNARLVVHYDILPRYLRGVRRFLKVPEKIMLSLLSTLTRLSLQTVKHGDDIPDYPHLHLNAMETVTAIAEELIPKISIDPSMQWLGKLIGNKPALAYAAKHLSQFMLFPHILPLIVCYKSIHAPDSYLVVWNPGLPADWYTVIQQKLEGIACEFFKWPPWYLAIQRFFATLKISLRIPVITLRYILKRGITNKNIQKKSYTVMTEFIDPKRLNGTVYDADYWIDQVNITKRDILFFLTSPQIKNLIKIGYSLTGIVKLFQEKEYTLAILDHLAYPVSVVRSLFMLYLTLIPSIWKLNGSMFCRILLESWAEYLEFLPLFLHYVSDSLIYLTLPNGHTPVRFNDAIVTGLCRRYGVKSYGCQTRTIYARNFEYCFDCFDIYLSWGTVWDCISKAKTMFIGTSRIVGCIYLDALLPLYTNYLEQNPAHKQKNTLTIAIFPTDISMKHHFTKNFTKAFLINCAQLAAKFPNYQFTVKSKDAKYTDIILAEKDFYKMYAQVSNNFSFLDQARHVYANVLISADIILAIGYTTPAIEGLSLGKRVICYSELKCGGQALKHLPDFIATNADELQRLFDLAVHDYHDYSVKHADSIEQLDPFRDGQALARIVRTLVKE